MAVVKGVKEKVHLPLYDSIEVKAGTQLRSTLTSNVMRFFVDVTGKTKLLTNMQAASLLPHWNTFEARALRVVISDLSARFAETPTAELTTIPVVRADGSPVQVGSPPAQKTIGLKNFNINDFVQLRRRLETERVRTVLLSFDEIGSLGSAANAVTFIGSETLPAGEFAEFDRGLVERLGSELQGKGANMPPNEQIIPNNGFGNVISKIIYNTVTTFFVGEKIMIQVPTWFFPAGAGPYAEHGGVVTHGYPNPQATFRFAEPVLIDTQQNFRVEIEVPESSLLADLQKLYGPLFIWVVLDGYMTRDVQ